MVSSYLICDLCGGFGPPASFLSENGLRLCYQCWYREQGGDDLSGVDPATEAAESDSPSNQGRDSNQECDGLDIDIKLIEDADPAQYRQLLGLDASLPAVRRN